MKFLVDMPLSPGLASWLAQKGHDAVHAAQAGLQRAADDQIIEWARSEFRIIVTADLDYPRLLAVDRLVSPGLILFRGGDFSEAECVARLARALESFSSEDLAQSVIVVERQRMRRRRLPITPE